MVSDAAMQFMRSAYESALSTGSSFRIFSKMHDATRLEISIPEECGCFDVSISDMHRFPSHRLMESDVQGRVISVKPIGSSHVMLYKYISSRRRLLELRLALIYCWMLLTMVPSYRFSPKMWPNIMVIMGNGFFLLGIREFLIPNS